MGQVLRQPGVGANGTTLASDGSTCSRGDHFDQVQSTGTGSVITHDNTHTIHGWATSMKWHYAAGVSSTLWCRWSAHIPAPTTQGKTSTYFYFPANPSVAIRLGNFMAGLTVSCSMLLQTNGTLRIANTSGSPIATTTATVPLNAWCRIEFEVTGITGTTGTVTLRLYSGANLEGTTPDTGGTITGSANVAGLVTEFRTGTSAGTTETTTFEYWASDVTYSDGAQPGAYAVPDGIYLWSEGAAGKNPTAATSINVPFPLDLTGPNLQMVMMVDNASGTGVPPTNPSGDGWHQIDAHAANGGAGAPNMLVARKQATGSESGNQVVATASGRANGKILAFAGVDPVNPEAVTATFVDSTAATTVVIPGVDPPVTDCVLIYCACHNGNTETSTPPSSPAGFAEVMDNPSGAWNGAMGYAAYPADTPTGDVTVTFTGSSRGLGVLVALRPAGGSAEVVGPAPPSIGFTAAAGTVTAGQTAEGPAPTIGLAPVPGVVTAGATVTGPTVPDINVTAVPGTATGAVAAVVTGSAPNVAWTAAAGVVTSGQTAVGPTVTIELDAPPGAATAGTTVTGPAPLGISAAAVQGTVTGAVAGNVTGQAPNVVWTAQPGQVTAVQSVDLAGPAATVVYAAQAGAVTTGAVVEGFTPNVAFQALTGALSGAANITGRPLEVAYAAPAGNVQAGASVDGTPTQVTFAALAGAAAGYGAFTVARDPHLTLANRPSTLGPVVAGAALTTSVGAAALETRVDGGTLTLTQPTTEGP